MSRYHTEAAFESAIERHLLTSGDYSKGDKNAFDQERCLDSVLSINELSKCLF